MPSLTKKPVVALFSLLVGMILLANIGSVNASNADSHKFTYGNASNEASVLACSNTVIVTNAADSGAGSLRDAMANVCAGGTIIFDQALTSSGPTTITLLTALPTISSNITITGPGANLLTLQRSTDPGTPIFRIFTIQSGTVAVSGLTVTNGKTTNGVAGNFGGSGDDGGGIENFGSLTLMDVTVVANSTGVGGDGVSFGGRGGFGGGIYNTGTLVMTNCTVNGNTTGRGGNGTNGAGKGGDGGGIYNLNSLTMTGCLVNGNTTGKSGDTGGIGDTGGRGAGIYTQGGPVTLTSLTVSNNSAGDSGTGGNGNGGFGGHGGGIYIGSGTVKLTNSAVGSNRAGLSATGTGGYSGGIDNNGALTVTNSTISGNKGNAAGGILNRLTLTMVNSTVSGNTENGINNASSSATVALTNCTVTGNPNLGIINSNSASAFTLKNTIVAGNASVDGSDVAGAFSSQGFNLIGKDTGGFLVASGFSNGVNNDKVGTPGAPIDAMLAPLAYYGGPTMTHLPLPGSPAVNAGSNALAKGQDNNDLTTDQRGAGYPRVVNSTVDIGAVEVGDLNYAVTATAGTPQSTKINTAFTTPMQVTVTESGTLKSGIPVTFTAPSVGASGTFEGGNAVVTVLTDSNGIAVAPAFTANAKAGGSYNVIASINGGALSTTFNLTNLKGQAQVNLSNLVQTYDGTPKSVAVITAPPGLNAAVTYDGSTPPTNAGSYVVTATINDADYYGQATGTLIINKANQTISFGAIAAKTFGDPNFSVNPVASSGLNVTISVTGQCTVSGNNIGITGAGSCTVTASQTGNTNFNPAAGVAQTFTIATAAATVTLGNLSQTYSGSARLAQVTTNPFGLSVTVTYSRNGSPVSSPINAGAYNVTATINNPNYQGSTTGVLVINKATPSIFWSNPASIIVGTPLSGSQLNASASVPGTYQYDPSAGTVLGIGTSQLSVTFTPTDTANYTTATKSVTLTVNPVPSPTLFFNSTVNVVNEGAGNIAITVTRTGDTVPAVSVNYTTSDSAGLTPCNVVNSIASSRCDYATTIGRLQFASGETIKTIYIPIVDDSWSEGTERFTLSLSNPSGANLGSTTSVNVNINDNDTSTSGTNPIDQNAFFIRQQYIDFLGREPDAGGLQGWQDVLTNCGVTIAQPCDKIEVSAGFFRSKEFQERGYFIYKFYSAIGRIPLYPEFMPDLAKVSGFLSDAQLEDSKTAFVTEFMARSDYQTRYGPITDPTAYVNALLSTVGLPNHPSRDGWIAGLANNTLTKAKVFRELTESSEMQQKYSTESFVIMQYFGYLRRSADASYLAWIDIMNQNPTNYRGMIDGFINSDEYRKRFGQ